MYSNAAKRVGLGYGGICQNSWMFGKWTDAFLNEKDPSIEYLELYALVGMVMNLIHHFCNRRIILFCDNQAVVHMVNNTSSSCKNCIVLIRKLVLNSLCDNVCIFARYVRSWDNTASDLLSCQKLSDFRSHKATWDLQPTPIPHELVDLDSLWVNCSYCIFNYRLHEEDSQL